MVKTEKDNPTEYRSIEWHLNIAFTREISTLLSDERTTISIGSWLNRK